jgi:hypothetical protein
LLRHGLTTFPRHQLPVKTEFATESQPQAALEEFIAEKVATVRAGGGSQQVRDARIACNVSLHRLTHFLQPPQQRAFEAFSRYAQAQGHGALKLQRIVSVEATPNLIIPGYSRFLVEVDITPEANPVATPIRISHLVHAENEGAIKCQLKHLLQWRPVRCCGEGRQGQGDTCTRQGSHCAQSASHSLRHRRGASTL